MASHPRTARPVRASSVFAITPADDIYAEWAQCTPCTWVAAGYRHFKLKYVNNSCPQHAGLRKIAS